MPPFRAGRDDALLERAAADLGVGALAPERRAALSAYVDSVARWNRRVDLTGAKRAEDQVEVLAADALVLATAPLLPRGSRLLDVGAGAGAPTLPLLLLRRDLRAVLLEPLHKRVAFLRSAIGAQRLEDRALVVEGRLEDAALPAVDVALSRATFAPALWLERAVSLAPLVLVLSREEAPPAPVGWRRVDDRRYALPFAGTPRRILAYASGSTISST